jgi:hypothetical protein
MSAWTALAVPCSWQSVFRVLLVSHRRVALPFKNTTANREHHIAHQLHSLITSHNLVLSSLVAWQIRVRLLLALANAGACNSANVLPCLALP